MASVASTTWTPANQTLTEAVRWSIFGIITWINMNGMGGLGSIGTAPFSALAKSLHVAAFTMALVALPQFWLDLPWFPSIPPGATFDNRNMFAEFLAAAFPFSVWLLWKQNKPMRTVVTAVGTGVILVALMSTGTRAALIAVSLCIVLSLMFALFFRRPDASKKPPAINRWLALLVPLAVVAALGWIPTDNNYLIDGNTALSRGLTPVERTAIRLQSLGNSATYVPDSSFGVRWAAWDTGLKMVQTHPVRGVGAGGWSTTSPLYAPETLDSESLWMAHNEALQLVAEYGLAGMAALLALAAVLALALLHTVRTRKNAADAEANFRTWFAALSVAMFAVVSMSGTSLHMATSTYLQAICLGCMLAVLSYRIFQLRGTVAG